MKAGGHVRCYSSTWLDLQSTRFGSRSDRADNPTCIQQSFSECSMDEGQSGHPAGRATSPKSRCAGLAPSFRTFSQFADDRESGRRFRHRSNGRYWVVSGHCRGGHSRRWDDLDGSQTEPAQKASCQVPFIFADVRRTFCGGEATECCL